MNETDLRTVRPAMAELVALAVAVRPDWDADRLRDALVACHQAGWPWTRTMRQTVELLCDESGAPRDLAAAARNPLRRQAPDPGAYERGAAAARAALGVPEKLTDPDCQAGKHATCVGGPCECDCHREAR